MSEAKFTKGPWHYDKELGAIYNDKCNYICDAPKNNSADKHLIAAAPKMYEMLERLIGNYQEAASIAEHEGYETRYAQDAILVDLLLAEARGETNGK